MRLLTSYRALSVVRHSTIVARLRGAYAAPRLCRPFSGFPCTMTGPASAAPDAANAAVPITAAAAAIDGTSATAPDVANAAVPAVPAAAKSGPAATFGMEAEAVALKEFAEIPVVGGVVVREVGKNGVLLSVRVSQRNLAANSRRKFSVPVVLPDAQHPHAADPFVGPPAETPATALSSLSPSGRLSFTAKAGMGEGKTEGSTLEVWNDSRLVLELVVPTGVHGGVMNDEWFSTGAAWSPDEDKIVYVAEAPTQDATPTWGGEPAKESAGPKTWKGKGKWQEDWGELYEGKRAPCLFLLDINAKSVKKLAPHDDDYLKCSYGQPTWCPDGKGVIAVAWPHQPLNYSPVAKRLGVVYCMNRPCHLVHVPLEASEEGKPPLPAPLDPAQQGNALSPVFTPDGSRLLFLSHEAAVRSGAHNATAALFSFPWPLPTDGAPPPSATPIVPVVSRSSSPTAFPGLYASNIPNQAFLDPDTLLITSLWRSQQVVLKVTLSTGEVTPVTPLGVDAGSWAFCGTARGVVVAVHSSPSQPPRVMTASPGKATTAPPWDWQPVPGLLPNWHPSPDALSVLSNLKVNILTVTPTVGPPHAFEAVTIFPKDAPGPCPTILVPHGGPHSNLPVMYFMPYLLLVRAGYGLVAVNYRGSTGFGEDMLQALPGNIGTYDVADCIAALDAAVDAGLADPGNVAVIGGSHGGFLTGHLLGQHPERFKAGVMRNPVCNLALMSGTSDILDWIYIEAYGSEEGLRRFKGQIPTPEELAHFYAVSPAAHVAKVRAPIAFMLGAKDLRVPLSDGKQYAAALQAQGVDTHVVVFPEDTHGLDKPQTEFEQWITALWWLRKHGMP